MKNEIQAGYSHIIVSSGLPYVAYVEAKGDPIDVAYSVAPPLVRPILVGEANPYSGADPRFALYPEPAYSAGGRLCRLVLGLEPRQYLRRYDRRNLCGDKWRIVEARAAALKVREELEARALEEPPGQHAGVAVLLGSKVCQAFGVDFRPFSVMAMVGMWRAVILPHPSGLSRAWNEPGAFERAREVLREAGAP